MSEDKTEPRASVLVVDDTPENLQILSTILRDRGHAVRVARSGQAALASVAAEAPDLIVLDIMMPEMDGYEVCRRLKAVPATAGIPVIFISALDGKADKVQGFAVGAVDFVTKPFAEEEVAARVDAHLSLRRLQRRLIEQNRELAQEVRERSKAEATMRAMSEASLDAVIMIDSRDRVLFWNPAAERMFGYTRSEMLGTPLHARIIQPEMAGPVRRGLETFVRTGDGPIVQRMRELMARRRDGSDLPVELSVSAFQLDGEWHAVGTVRDISARKAAEAQLVQLATTDGLTGIANRRHFMTQAAAELERALRHRRPLAVLMVDADHFKDVNDRYGHEAGDQALRAIAKLLAHHLRETDLLGRIGGEEFAVLLPDCPTERALLIAQRLCMRMAETRLSGPDGPPFFVTLSIGIAEAHPIEAANLSALLALADQRLYRAKQAGRNRAEGPERL